MKRTMLFLMLVALVLTAALPAFAAEQDCPLCGEAAWTEVTAADWAAGGAVTTGHYRLTENIDLTAALTVAAGETVCVDLAGCSLTQTATSTETIYMLRVFENSGTLTVLDSVGDGEITGGYCYANAKDSTTNGGNIWCAAGSVFNLYGGKLTGGTVQRKYHAKDTFGGGNLYSEGTVNIYGGTVTGGKVWGNLAGATSTPSRRYTYLAGGNILVSGGELNVCGGSITDGVVLNESYGKAAPGTYYAQGGNVYAVDATVNISGGALTGGAVTGNNKGVDSTSGTDVVSKALGGNLAVSGSSTLTVSGGELTGGVASATVTAYGDNTLTTKTREIYGGNIFGSSSSSIRISGGVISGGQAYMGGNIYSANVLNITGGEIADGVAQAEEDMTANYGGNVYSAKTLTVTGGTLTGGTAERGGNVYVGKTMTFTGGTLKGGVAAGRGGNIGTMSGTLNITGGTIVEGYAGGYGGNVWCAGVMYIYGGSIYDPVSDNNIMLITNATAYIYGGTIHNGEFGEAIYAFDGTSADPGHIYMYGGNVGVIRTGTAGTNNIHIYNGSVGGFFCGSRTVGLEDLDANVDGLPVVPECAHITEESGYIIWHHFESTCDGCGHTYGSEACETCNTTHKLPQGGTHTYEVDADTGVAACIYCGLSQDGKVCCAIDGEYYEDLETALAEGKTLGKTVKLIKDLEIENLNLYGALDLAGYTLTVTGVLGAENKNAALSDSVGTGTIIGKVFMNESNAQVAVPVDGGWKLERVAMTQTVETVSDDEVTLNFVITDAAADTWLDEATVNGDEYKVRIQVKWTENGVEKVHYFRYNADLVKAYASAWGEKMYTCSITGLAALEDYTVTAQVVSGGVVVSARDITPPSTSSVSRYESGAGYTEVANMLSWEKIDSFPDKNDDLTIREMRQSVVDFYNFSRTFTWVPNEDVTYDVGPGYGQYSYQENGVYAGFAYVSLGTGNVYRFMDFMDETTGVVNIAEAIKYPTLFGNQCSESAYQAWGRFINSPTTSIYTAYMVQKNGYIPVGPYTYDETIDEFTEEYGTGTIIEENGLDVMYESYACLQLADGLVRKFPGGHTVMVASDAVVVRNEDGTIDPEKSYIMASDQTSGWTTGTNAMGDAYSCTKNVNVKWTFSYLIEKGYLPFTFAEWLGTDPVDVTEAAYSHTGDTISWSELQASTVTANYHILDIYAVFTDAEGNEVYRLAVRTQNPFTLELGFDLTAAERDGVPGSYQWGNVESLSADETYNVEIIAQLVTGERPTLWTGVYTG